VTACERWRYICANDRGIPLEQRDTVHVLFLACEWTRYVYPELEAHVMVPARTMPSSGCLRSGLLYDDEHPDLAATSDLRHVSRGG
jgi:hypothetical protein